MENCPPQGGERDKEELASHLQDKAVGNESKLQPAQMQVEGGREGETTVEAAFQEGHQPRHLSLEK